MDADSNSDKDFKIEEEPSDLSEPQTAAKDESFDIDRINKSATDTTLRSEQFSPNTKSNKRTLFLIIILLLVLVGIWFIFFRNKSSNKNNGGSTPAPTSASSPISTPQPTQAPKKTLNRSEIALEVLNGSGVTGEAKRIGSKLQNLGYPVVKMGNADNSTYAQTQIFVKKNLLSKVDLVVADLKDIVKISSVAGELKEGTASARIIIGKDLQY